MELGRAARTDGHSAAATAMAITKASRRIQPTGELLRDLIRDPITSRAPATPSTEVKNPRRAREGPPARGPNRRSGRTLILGAGR